MRVLALLTCTIGLPAMGLAADGVPLIPRNVLFGNPEKLSPKVSPDGKMLAYIAPDHGVRNIWIRTIGASDDHAITSEHIRPIPEYHWLPDSRRLVYLQETKDLTPFDKVRSSVVAIDPQHPDQILLSMNKSKPELFDVYRFSFKTGAMDLDTENPGDVAAWHANHNLEVRAAEVLLDLRLGSLEKDEDFLRSRSPLFKADRIRAPLLIAQGANDPRVNKAESDQIVRAMRDNKKQVQYIVFPDEGHGFRRPENNMRFYAATEEFLSKHLGGRAEPPGCTCRA